MKRLRLDFRRLLSKSPFLTLFLKKLRQDKLLLFSCIILFLLCFSAIFANWIATGTYYGQNLADRLSTPSLQYPFGADYLGRDIFSRIIYGARIVLYEMVATISFAAVIGILAGLFSGYFGGSILDHGIMRIMDILSSFPTIMLALMAIIVIGAGLENAIIAVGISLVPSYARFVRSQTLSAKELDYIENLKALGASNTRILFRHILPNISGPIITLTTFSAASAILGIASLGFLGLGAQPPTPCWGTMISEGRLYMVSAPYVIIFPGIAIFLVVLSLNVLGDVLRDVLDPRQRNILMRPELSQQS